MHKIIPISVIGLGGAYLSFPAVHRYCVSHYRQAQIEASKDYDLCEFKNCTFNQSERDAQWRAVKRFNRWQRLKLICPSSGSGDTNYNRGD